MSARYGGTTDMHSEKEDSRNMTYDLLMHDESGQMGHPDGQDKQTRPQFIKRIGTLNKIARK